MTLSSFASLGLASGLMLVVPAVANAQQSDRERGSIVIGGFVTDRDTDTRVDSDSGDGTDIDLENDLGLKKSMSVARAGGYYWISRRNRIDVSFFDLSREATRQLDETIEFGDKVFNIDTVVTTKNDLTITKLDYTFAFLERDRGYFGIGGGLYVASTSTSLSEPTLGTTKSEGLTAPLPTLGLSGDFAIGDHFTLRGAWQWFGFDVGDISGGFRDFYLGADYRFGKRVSLGLAYDRVSLGIEAQKAGFEGRVDWGYDGYLLYLKLDFGR